MKKSLLLASFAIFATVASAQTTTCLATAESLAAAGLSTDGKLDIAGGAVIAKTDAGSIALAYDDSWGISNAYGSYKNVKVNGEEIALGSGAVGSKNPTFSGYADGVMSDGAVFELKPAKDGWVTIFTKFDPNKQYVVMEGKSGALAYTFGYSNGTVKINYTLPHNEYYAIDFSVDHDKYFTEAPADNLAACKPLKPYEQAGLESNPGANTGFVTFNVMGGETYYFSGLGTKVGCQGFVLTEGETEPTITFVATDELPEVVFGTGGAVESVEVAADENAPIYNMMGVRVSDDAKGILIQNGKKFIRK